MSNLFDLLVAGLAAGAIYALVAVGFTLLWQTSQTINFAQGEFVMLPAFLVLAAMHAGAPFWFAILIGILAGWIAEKVMHRNQGLLTNLIVGVVGGDLDVAETDAEAKRLALNGMLARAYREYLLPLQP